MSNAGKIKRVPLNVLAELDKVKKHKNLERDRDAFNEMAKLSEVGREIERIMRFGFMGRAK